MCFDSDSTPPVRAIAGAAVSHDRLTLTAADGNRFAAFLATPETTAAKGVVIYPDVRGLYHFYEELALRFAERGIAAIAFDYFGRTAGAGARDDEFDYRPHVDQTTDDGVQSDARAAVEQLRGAGTGPSSASDSALADVRRGWPQLGSRARRLGRLLRLSDPGARRPERRRACRCDRMPDSGAAGRRRCRDHRRRQRARSSRR